MKPIITLAVLCLLFACSKKQHREEEISSASLVLNLSQSVLSIGQVDSADVVFRKPGSSETSKAKFARQGTNLAASLQLLTPGTWNADVEVYTRAVNGQSNQYKTVQSILVTEARARVEIPGPRATPGNGWLKRHVKASTGNEVVVIVPDEVYDSYFEFRAKPGRRYVLGIQREAINVNYVVEQKTWACASACFNAQGLIIDTEHFMPFTQAILASPWTRNEISIGVLNEQQESVLIYDRTWVQ
ncbi:hypothetical protein HRH25_09255 [Flavisolibacter sp. BT320]|nr:hypothetical protein [Flavisolibacter longurius]